jgi:hypothetical protein
MFLGLPDPLVTGTDPRTGFWGFGAIIAGPTQLSIISYVIILCVIISP